VQLEKDFRWFIIYRGVTFTYLKVIFCALLNMKNMHFDNSTLAISGTMAAVFFVNSCLLIPGSFLGLPCISFLLMFHLPQASKERRHQGALSVQVAPPLLRVLRPELHPLFLLLGVLPSTLPYFSDHHFLPRFLPLAAQPPSDSQHILIHTRLH